jgi:dTMP kinase
MDPLTNAYLYAGARAQLIRTVIVPALELWKHVIADRSFVSSLAYQGKAQGLGIETILDLNMPIIEHCIPDLILTLDLPLEVALARMFDAKGDKWEKMNKTFFEKVIEGYRCASTLPFIRDRFHWVDATGDRDHVESRIRAIVLGRIRCYMKHA